MKTDDRLPGADTALSRRHVLTAAVAASGALAASPAVAETTAADAGFGSPVVELYVPAGVLSLEQRAALIKGITDVVLGALNRTPDPAKKMFMQIFETAEGGFGINGQVFVPRSR